MPELPNFAELSDTALKELIDELVREEDVVSYERRLIQGRLDILCYGQDVEAGVEELAKVLIGKAPPADEEALSPETRAQVDELRAQEQAISGRRRDLHWQIDMLRAELVARRQRSGGQSVLDEVDVDSLTDILAGKSAPPARASGGDGE